jgi:hypothetical protein
MAIPIIAGPLARRRRLEGDRERDTSVSTSQFRGTIRYFRAETSSGLAVVDVPPDVTAALGGLKQMRVQATVNGAKFVSNTMPAGGGKLALSLSKQILKDCGLSVGDEATFEVDRIP